jgi:uncharacterized membrane protein
MSEPEIDITKIVERNVNRLLQRKKQDREKSGPTAKFVALFIKYVGSIGSVLVHAAIIFAWVIWNLGFLSLKPFDPNFILLALTASVEAIFLTIFVLIGQKYSNAQADKWAELDLQISLLTEHEVTRTLTLITAIAKKMDIEIAGDKEIEALSKDIHPGKVLDTMEQASD